MKKASTQVVSEVSNTNLESKITELSNLVNQHIVGSGKQLMACGVCAVVGHNTDQCPLIVGGQEDVNALGGFQGQQRPPGFQNTYNPNWRNNNNNYPPKQFQQNTTTPPYQQQYTPPFPQHSQPQYNPQPQYPPQQTIFPQHAQPQYSTPSQE